MLTADSSPMPSKSRQFAKGRRTRAGFKCARFRPGAESPASTAAAHVKTLRLPDALHRHVDCHHGEQTPVVSLTAGVRMFGEMAVLIHVHPRLVLHGDEFKVRVALRALAVRMHQALCALGGHDYLRRVADNRIFLQCVTCGHETPGWRVDIARQRPKPATRNVPESDIARA